MTLGRRLALQLLLIWACAAALAAVGLWGVAGMRQDFSVALGNYEKLRQLYGIGFHLQSAAARLRSELVSPQLARREAVLAERAGRELAPALPVPAAERAGLVDALAALVAALDARQATANAVDAPLSRLAKVQTALRRQIEQQQAAADRRMRVTMTLLAGAAGAALLASIAVGAMQWRAVMRPLRAIGAGVQRLRAERFDAPIVIAPADREFSALAENFNSMAGELEATRRDLEQRVEAATRGLVQSERLAGVGLLAAGVAHEINNPLAIITGRLELLLSRTPDEAARAALRIALEEAFRCKAIIDRLLGLSRGPSGVRANVRLDTLAADVVARVRELPAVARRRIELSRAESINESIVIRADAGELRQAVLNLLINALAATGDDGRIDVTLRRAGEWAELCVADDGRGIDPGVMPRLFEPFYSVNPGERRGTGLGLWITRSIAESHGGAIDAHSDGVGRGSRFVLRLPSARVEGVTP